MKKFYQIFFFILVVILLTNCSSDNQTRGKIISNLHSDEASVDSLVDIIYSIPDPDEILDEIMIDKLKFKTGLENPLENADHYFESKSVAMNIGVYLTDMAYLLLLKNNSQAIDYFYAITKLSNNLGISTIQSEELYEYIRNNIDNQDSLYFIFKESIYNIKTELENSNQHKNLALIYTGSVIESLYLAVNNIDYNNSEMIIEKILEQSIVINNLYDFIEQYKLNSDLALTIKQLDSVKNFMNRYIKQNTPAKAQKDEQDNLTIEGGYKIEYSKEDFENVKLKIIELRNNIIAN